MRKVVLLTVFLVLFSASVFAVPNTLNVHGRLTYQNGSVVTGTQTFIFSIYNVASGGSALYQTMKFLNVDAQGRYNAVLDGVSLPFDQQYFLGVQIGVDPEMSPRINLTSVPYAFKANEATSLEVSGNYSVNKLSANVICLAGDCRSAWNSTNATIIESDPVFSGENASIWLAINSKANASDVYTISEINNLLANLSNISLNITETDPVFNAWLLGTPPLYSESDPFFSLSPSFNITNLDISNWNSAYGWGNHALYGYLTSTANICLPGEYSRFNGTGFECFTDSGMGNESDPIWNSEKGLYYNSSQIDFLILNISLTPGPQGPPGANGTNGNSVTISSVIDNLDGTYTWYFSDGYNFTTSNLKGADGVNGTNGVDGVNGTNGINGIDGVNGTSVTISSVINNGDGTYTWQFSDGYNFTTGNLTGPQGPQGPAGINGADGANGTNGIDGVNGTSVTISNIIDNLDGTFTWQFSDGFNFTTSNITGPQGLQGPPGANGIDGVNGTSITISNIIDNLDGTFTWQFSDGYNFTTSNLTGPQGIQGISGTNGTNGIDGVNGTSVYFLSIDDLNDGTFVWHFSDGFNFTTSNLTGPMGPQGPQGIPGVNGTDGVNGTSVTISNIVDNLDGTFTWQFSDGYNFTTSNLTGPQGIQGVAGVNGTNGIDGVNGTSLTMSSITNNLDGTYTWYFSDGTNFTTGNLTGPQGIAGTNGIDGVNGTNGIDGVNGTSVNITSVINNGDGTYTWYFSTGYNFTTGNLTGPQGPQGIQGPAGVNGTNGIDGVNGTSFDVGGNYLYNNGSNVIFFNETKLQAFNNTIKVYTYSTIITTVAGSGTATTPVLDAYVITKITATPTTLNNTYNFEALENSTSDVIDRNRATRTGQWNIKKYYSISNEAVKYNIANASIDEAFNVTITYQNNIGGV